MKREKRPLDALIEEARTAMKPSHESPSCDANTGTDWGAQEAKLFDRIAQEDAARGSNVTSNDRGSPRKTRVFTIASTGLAIAAAIAFFVGRGDHTSASNFDAVNAKAASNGAHANVRSSSVVQHRGGGKIEIDGADVADGSGAFVGDEIETRGTTAFFERRGTEASAAEIAVRWSMEDATKVRITHGAENDGTLILALERGAVEAQVTPVDHGEAFAVDVEGVRVAVHGTHLRVAREAHDVAPGTTSAKVTVDLSEGVISVGTAPKAGSTYGEFVTAPAHVEFDTSDVHGTWHVTKLASSVRTPNTFPTIAPPAHRGDRGERAENRNDDRAFDRGAIASPTVHPQPNVSHQAASSPPFSQKPSAIESLSTSLKADPNADQAVAAAVRACATNATSSAPSDASLGSVKVTVTTMLEVRTSEGGNVEAARFDPPLAPEVQRCAAETIYKTRFVRGDVFRIPIQVETVR